MDDSTINQRLDALRAILDRQNEILDQLQERRRELGAGRPPMELQSEINVARSRFNEVNSAIDAAVQSNNEI